MERPIKRFEPDVEGAGRKAPPIILKEVYEQRFDEADQARKGLIDSVKGKVKEIAGDVIGNDSLTAEGQLEQTQAQERKAANSVEAVADAEAEQAHGEAAEAKLEAAKERIDVNAEAAAVERSVSAQQGAQKTAAEQAGAQDAARAETQAELDAQQRYNGEDRGNRRINAAAEGRRGRRTSSDGPHRNERPRRSRPDQERERAPDRRRRPDLSTVKRLELAMKITTVPFAVLRFQYHLVRFPLQVIEDGGGPDGCRSPRPAVLRADLGVLGDVATRWATRSSKAGLR
jgi:uncharacterized protein YjbJ (UPF0337 family)